MNGQKYRVIRTLASGSTSVLYEAIQTSLDRKVIIKKLHSHLTSEPDFITRFETEARIAASLNHENIVRIIDSGKQKNSYYIVMEHIEGMSLRTFMDRERSLEQDTALLIAYGICSGLSHAHGRGIIHRDIKPANIMISTEGIVKITDFGLARLLRDRVGQTQAGSLLGTPLYMSPEQAVGERVDGRSDIFSLGTMCFEMVTGRKPFRGDNYASVISNIISSSPRELSEQLSNAQLSEDIILKALQKNPDRRFSSADEMAGRIQNTLERDRILSAPEIIKSRVYGTRSPAAGRISPKKKKKGGRLLRFAAAAALCAGIVAVALNPGQIGSVIDNLRSGEEEIMPSALSGNSGFGFIEVEHEPAAPDTAVAEKEEEKPQPDVEPEAADTAAAYAPPPEKPAERKEDQKKKPQQEKIATGYLDLHVRPEAAIFVDGEQEIFGNHLGPMPISPGRHSILIRRNGYENYNEVLTVIADELSRRRIELVRKKGRIAISTQPGAKLYIDGEHVGITPLGGPLVTESGSRELRLVKEGFVTWQNVVEIEPGGTLRLDVTMIEE